MIEYTDPYQWVRMLVIWPMLIIAPTASLAALLLVGIRSPNYTRSQVVICTAIGLLAAIVGGAIAVNWNGSNSVWVAFTLGLVFTGLILWTTLFTLWMRAK